MTINHALRIQRAQMVWYRQSIGRAGVKAIRAATTLPNINADLPVPVFTVNKYIPRGGAFEKYLDDTRRPSQDPNTDAWHDAIMRGLQ